MLLGMKSTIGEVELHVMAQRLAASKKAAAARGELCLSGMSTTRPARSSSTPMPRVQAAIGDLFAAFAACGSAYGVVAAFTDRRFPLRAYGGAWAGQLRWGRLTHARVLGVLKNPCYAGAYVHGRYTSRRSLDPEGTVRTSLIERPRAQWPVVAELRKPRARHDPGRVLVDMAVTVADGATTISAIAVLTDQAELFGAVPSDSTCWRLLEKLEISQLGVIGSAQAAAREVVWAQRAEATDEPFPLARAAGRELPGLVLDLDASVVICHSEKEQGAPTFNR